MPNRIKKPPRKFEVLNLKFVNLIDLTVVEVVLEHIRPCLTKK